MGCLPNQHHNGLDELHHEDGRLGMTGQDTVSSLNQPPTHGADMMNTVHGTSRALSISASLNSNCEPSCGQYRGMA